MKKQGSVPKRFRVGRSPSFASRGAASAATRASAVVVIAVYAIVISGVTLPTPLYLDFQERWSLTNAEIAGLYALYPVGVLLVLLAVGHWADEIGRRPVMALAVVSSAASSAILLAAVSPWMVAGARLLTGVASGFVVNAANALLVELAPRGARRRASIASTIVNQFGLGMGAVASALLIQLAGHPTQLVFAWHLAALSMAMGLLWCMPETRPASHRPTLRLQAPRIPARRRGEFFAAAFAAFAAFALCGLLAALAPAMIREQFETVSPLYSAAAVGLVFFSSGLSQLVWAAVADTTSLMLGSGLLVIGLAMLTLGMAISSGSVFFLGVTIGGAAVGGLFMSSLALVNHAVADEHRAGTTSTYFLVTFSGLILPVVGTGLAADRFDQLQATVLFGSVVGLVSILAAVLLKASRRTGEG